MFDAAPADGERNAPGASETHVLVVVVAAVGVQAVWSAGTPDTAVYRQHRADVLSRNAAGKLLRALVRAEVAEAELPA